MEDSELLTILKKFHSISGRVELAIAFGFSFKKWKNFKILEKPRNEAVHAGKIPTKKDTIDCYNMAKDFILANSINFIFDKGNKSNIYVEEDIS